MVALILVLIVNPDAEFDIPDVQLVLLIDQEHHFFQFVFVFFVHTSEKVVFSDFDKVEP